LFPPVAPLDQNPYGRQLLLGYFFGGAPGGFSCATVFNPTALEHKNQPNFKKPSLRCPTSPRYELIMSINGVKKDVRPEERNKLETKKKDANTFNTSSYK